MDKQLLRLATGLALVLASVVSAPSAQATTIASPSNLRAISVDVGAITVAWSAPSSFDATTIGYQLQYSVIGSGTWSSYSGSLPIAVTGATIKGLARGTDYSIRVRVTAEAVDSAWTYALPSTGSGLREVSLAYGVACGITMNQGKIFCWGYGREGQLGNGVLADSTTPVAVATVRTFKQVAAGDYHSCAVEITGSVYCWGAGDSGQLGNGQQSNSVTPVRAVGITDAVSVGVGYGFSCALHANGNVSCWGVNDRGQLGLGLAVASKSTPTEIDVVDMVQLDSGDSHTCAVRVDRRVYCWGLGTDGQLGSGLASKYVPTAADTQDIVEVSASYDATCGTHVNGKLSCWGDNADGWLGGLAPKQPLPIYVDGVTDALHVSTGFRHLCVELADESVTCRGANSSGQLAVGDLQARAGWAAMAGVTGVHQVVAGDGVDTCLLEHSGALRCAGANWYGVHSLGTPNSKVTSLTDSEFFAGSKLTTPDLPGQVAALTTAFPKAKSARLSWLAVAENGRPVTKYAVSWKLASASKWGAWKSVGTNLTLTIAGLKKGVKYSVRVQATNAVGSSVSKVFTLKPTK